MPSPLAIFPPTPFRPVDTHSAAGPGGQSLAAVPLGKDWFVRIGGSNNNGGSSTSLSAERTGADGVLNNTSTFTSATASFTQADVNKGICINTGASARRHKIVAVTNSTTITLDRSVGLTASGLTWAIGGAWADWRAPLGDAAVTGDLNSPLQRGDIAYIGAGTYRMTVTINMASGINQGFGVPITIKGDVTGQKTGDAGMVMITSFGVNDKTLPFTGVLFAGGNTTTAVKFQDLFFVHGGTSGSNLLFSFNGGESNQTFSRCAFLNFSSTGSAIQGATMPNGPSRFLIEDCFFFTSGIPLRFSLSRSALYDYDCDVIIRRNVIIQPINNGSIRFETGGTNIGAKIGGGKVYSNTFIGGNPVITTTDASNATTFPVIFVGNLVLGGGTIIQAAANGQILEDYNLISTTGTVRLNVPVGFHSIINGSYATLMHLGQEIIWKGTQRPFGEPMQSSPLRGFGSSDTIAGATDVRGIPRPSSSPQWDVGAIQRGNTGIQEISITQAGGNSIKIIGFGTQDFDVPVDATPTTLSIYIRYDSNYVGPLPQVQVVNAGQVGVGDYTLPISTNSLNNWVQYSITINPTAAGIVTLRIVAGDVSGVGNTYIDTFSMS